MKAHQAIISLRPGGGGNRGSGIGALRFHNAASSPADRSHGGAGDSVILKIGDMRFDKHERFNYTRDELLKYREVADISEDILKIKKEIEAEIYGDQTWSRGDANLQNQLRCPYSETDNRDWQSRSMTFPAAGEGRHRDAILNNKVFLSARQQEVSQTSRKDQLNSTNSSTRGVEPAPSLLKAEVLWFARRGNLSEKEQVLKTVKGAGWCLSTLHNGSGMMSELVGSVARAIKAKTGALVVLRVQLHAPTTIWVLQFTTRDQRSLARVGDSLSPRRGLLTMFGAKARRKDEKGATIQEYEFSKFGAAALRR